MAFSSNNGQIHDAAYFQEAEGKLSSFFLVSGKKYPFSSYFYLTSLSILFCECKNLQNFPWIIQERELRRF